MSVKLDCDLFFLYYKHLQYYEGEIETKNWHKIIDNYSSQQSHRSVILRVAVIK